MKKIFVLICLLFAAHLCVAQNNADVLNKYGAYFKQAEIRNNEMLVCTTTDTYASLSNDEKEKIMGDALKISGYNVSLVLAGQQQEIWTRQGEKGILIDNWTLKIPEDKVPQIQNQSNSPDSISFLSKIGKMPWFVYLGSNGMFGKEMTNFYASSRAGLFLYDDRWDAALTMTLGSANKVFMFNVGVNSRVYFPLTFHEQRFAPYVGLGLTFNVMSGGNYWDTPIYAGTSWYIGPGSLDIGVQAWKNFAVTIGYTFSPRLKK
ncbi:MAG: hypothetical protein LBT50_08740 [Prevotellaceae bacterium]|jgi:hypothetical protein|nr:hypothetical protein [Prevotellaceae bacterium]